MIRLALAHLSMVVLAILLWAIDQAAGPSLTNSRWWEEQ